MNSKHFLRRCRNALCVSAVTLIAACAGGTFGTGLVNPGSGISAGMQDGSAVSGDSYSTIRTTLYDNAGGPLKGISVVVETEQSTDTSAVSDEQGEAISSVMLQPGEPITLRFFRSGRSIGSRIIKHWQADDGSIDLNFHQDRSGRIH